jgi:hypothetical protein
MASIEGLGPNPTRAELEDELVFARILVESLDPDAFDYEELVERHMAKIAQIESRLGIEEGESSGSHESQTASQESWTSLHMPPEFGNGDLEEMLSPVASFNAINANGEAEATGK